MIVNILESLKISEVEDIKSEDVLNFWTIHTPPFAGFVRLGMDW